MKTNYLNDETASMKSAFDNSAQYLVNPHLTASVTLGDQTTREMFVGFIDYAD